MSAVAICLPAVVGLALLFGATPSSADTLRDDSPARGMFPVQKVSGGTTSIVLKKPYRSRSTALYKKQHAHIDDATPSSSVADEASQHDDSKPGHEARPAHQAGHAASPPASKQPKEKPAETARKVEYTTKARMTLKGFVHEKHPVADFSKGVAALLEGGDDEEEDEADENKEEDDEDSTVEAKDTAEVDTSFAPGDLAAWSPHAREPGYTGRWKPVTIVAKKIAEDGSVSYKIERRGVVTHVPQSQLRFLTNVKNPRKAEEAQQRHDKVSGATANAIVQGTKVQGTKAQQEMQEAENEYAETVQATRKLMKMKEEDDLAAQLEQIQKEERRIADEEMRISQQERRIAFSKSKDEDDELAKKEQIEELNQRQAALKAQYEVEKGKAADVQERMKKREEHSKAKTVIKGSSSKQQLAEAQDLKRTILSEGFTSNDLEAQRVVRSGATVDPNSGTSMSWGMTLIELGAIAAIFFGFRSFRTTILSGQRQKDWDSADDKADRRTIVQMVLRESRIIAGLASRALGQQFSSGAAEKHPPFELGMLEHESDRVPVDESPRGEEEVHPQVGSMPTKKLAEDSETSAPEVTEPAEPATSNPLDQQEVAETVTSPKVEEVKEDPSSLAEIVLPTAEDNKELIRSALAMSLKRGMIRKKKTPTTDDVGL